MLENNILYMVIPCYNEHECLFDSAEKLKNKINYLINEKLISNLSKIVFVDDGSKDNTWELINQLNNKDKLFVGVKLAHNKGHQNAVMAGVDFASQHADMIISMDADLQDDINAIDEMVKKYHEGYEVVYGVRSDRTSDSKFKRWTANSYYNVLRHLGVEVINQHADFRLMSNKASKALLSYQESNLFLRGIVPNIGFKSCKVSYQRQKRLYGESKYPLSKMLHLAWDGITSFSIKPLRFVSCIGILLTSITVLVMIIYSILFACDVMPLTMSFYILDSIWMALGINLMLMGIIGEYIGKIYIEVKHRPRYIIEKIIE